MLNETGKCKEGTVGASLANLTVVFRRALRGLRACSHPACAFGGLVCWAALGWRGCGRLACMADGHCRQGQCGGCAAASLLACSAVLLPGWLMNCQRPVYVLGGLACRAAPGWLTRRSLACPLGAHCWGMVCCVCLAALHRACGGWASCLRQSILTSGFHVWGPMCRRGFRARRPHSCGSRTERRVARCAARCTGCFPAWRLFPR